MKPVNNLLMLEPVEAKRSSIILVKDDVSQHIGKVLAVGDLVTKFKPGLTIIFKSTHKTEVEYDGNKYWFVEEDAVLGYLDG